MRLRRAYEILVPLVGAGLIVWLSVTATDLPDPLAIHWGSGGEPDGSGSLGVITVVAVALVAGLGGLMVLGARRMPDPTGARMLVGAGHWMTGFGIGIHLFTLRANAGAASWEQAAPLMGSDLALVLLLGAPLAAIGASVAGDRDTIVATMLEADDEAVAGAPVEGLVWTAATRGRAVVVMLLLAAATNAVMWFIAPPGAQPLILAVVLLPVVLLFLFMEARVTVGPTGIRIGMGPWRWPGAKVGFDEVSDVAVEVVEPLRYGGWGYRIVPGVRAILVRKGEGLRIERHDAPTLVVTVDDARTGAAVIRRHLGVTSDA